MNFEPAGNNKNALLEVAFVIEFEREFTQHELNWVDSKSMFWYETLPGKLVIPKEPVALPPFQTNIGNDNNFGLSYQYYNPDGSIRQSLKFEGNRIVYLVSEYSKWAEIWPLTKKILEPIYNYLSSTNSVRSFSTEYLNLFVFGEEYFSMDISSILRSNNMLVPSHIFDRKLNWHAHTGYFEEENDPVQHRLLTRINFDLRDNTNNHRRELTLLLFHSMMPQHKHFSSGLEFLPEELKSKGLLNFRTLHLRARKVLNQLLCDEMLIKIGLT